MIDELIDDSFPILKTNRLSLIEIKQSHLKDIFKLFGDDSVTKFYNVKTLDCEEEGRKYIDWFSSRYRDGLGIRWGIAQQESEGIIGTLGFSNYTKNHRATIGYDLQKEYWNRGYITEALQAVIDYGFNKLEVNRIEAEVMVGNIVSEKVLSKLGFTNEGVLRQWMYWDNRHFDMIMYSLVKSDYSK